MSSNGDKTEVVSMGGGKVGVVTCLADLVSCQPQVTSHRARFLKGQSFSVWEGPVTDWTRSSPLKSVSHHVTSTLTASQTKHTAHNCTRSALRHLAPPPPHPTHPSLILHGRGFARSSWFRSSRPPRSCFWRDTL